jgi:hypothetical protein
MNTTLLQLLVKNTILCRPVHHVARFDRR